MKSSKRALRRHKGLAKFIKRLQHKIDTECYGYNGIEDYKRRNLWIGLLKHTVKFCSCDSCRNPRHNRWLRSKEKMTKQERKSLESFLEQLEELTNESFDPR